MVAVQSFTSRDIWITILTAGLVAIEAPATSYDGP